MSSPSHRMPLIDALKGAACLMIVAHHLAFYGPMCDAAHPLAPELIDWLYEYGRMAVPVFLAVGGYLSAGALAPGGRPRMPRAAASIMNRYQRLAVPCLAALTLAIGCSAVARQLMTHESISAPPTLGQLFAHLLLLQNLMGLEALSAGIWYVAIDLQLYVVAFALLGTAAALGRRDARLEAIAAPTLVSALAAAALFVFGRDARLDDTALYFFGTYGLGMLARWSGDTRCPLKWIVAMAALGGAALLFDFRIRIAVGLVTALMLAIGQRPGAAAWLRIPVPALWLGKRSYSIFLVHFPVSLVVNGLVTRIWPDQPGPAAAGMAFAFCLSLATGALFHRTVEARTKPEEPDFRYHAGFLTAGVAAMLAGV